MAETYVDSLPTAEKSAHKAVLARHDDTDARLEQLDLKLNALAVAANELVRAVEAVLSYEDSRLFRALRWLRLI